MSQDRNVSIAWQRGYGVYKSKNSLVSCDHEVQVCAYIMAGADLHRRFLQESIARDSELL